MIGSRLVKDTMIPVVQIEANETADEALQKLKQNNVLYAVVNDVEGNFLGIIKRDQLYAAKADERVQVLASLISQVILVSLHDTLNSVVQMLSEDLQVNYNLVGIIVQSQGNIQGILLPKTIIEHAISMLSGRRLAGSALTKLPLFECPIDREQKRVSYYDPRKPPKCSNGHKMERVKE